MDFSTLEHIETDELLTAFNRSFSDYMVPLQLTREQLEQKMITDRIDTSLSVGAFEDHRLIGFILHGCDVVNGQNTLYNAGTGVVPEHRGQKITRRLYDHILPQLAARNIERCLLEVIEGNTAAIATYQAIGFTKTGKLDCYKGTVEGEIDGHTPEIQALTALDWPLLSSFWDWRPTWQNAPAAVEKAAGMYAAIGLMEHGQPVAYAIYRRGTGSVLQFAVARQSRRQGMATRLFRHIAAGSRQNISLINIDAGATETAAFLESIGLTVFIRQNAMELNLKK